jgi:hypothetical protein
MIYRFSASYLNALAIQLGCSSHHQRRKIQEKRRMDDSPRQF